MHRGMHVWLCTSCWHKCCSNWRQTLVSPGSVPSLCLPRISPSHVLHLLSSKGKMMSLSFWQNSQMKPLAWHSWKEKR